MPYITPADRTELDDRTRAPSTAGELNYALTRIIDSYVNEKGFRYATVNEVVGALECAKLELYRRLAAPYEDQKCAENGDVYRSGPES